MAHIQLGNLGNYGFRSDLFGNYDFFDYDYQTDPTATGVRIYADGANYTEITGAGLAYTYEDGVIFGLTSGEIYSIKQVTNGATIFEATGLNIPATVISDIISYGTADQGLRYLMSQDDTVIGSWASDTLFGGVGTNVLDGREGTDTVFYYGNASDYQLSFNADGTVSVAGNQTQDTLISIERIKFDDGALALDTDGIAGQAYRIYQAAFDRTPDVAGLSYWIKAMDDGISLMEVATGFVGSQEFADIYGQSPTNSDFVEKLYQNVLGREGEAGGVSYWVSQLNQGKSQAQVLADFSESPENVQGVAPAIADGIWFY
jgi:hypothetical protein